MAQELEHPKDQKTHHEPVVRIHIDRNPYESLNPTSGAALYVLGKVPPSHQLYREVEGDQEDEPIENGLEQVHLQPDEHFYSKEGHHKGFTIIVNTRVNGGAKVRRVAGRSKSAAPHRDLRENGDGWSAMEADGAVVVLTEAQECIRTWTSG
jgi:hypothetical protein